MEHHPWRPHQIQGNNNNVCPTCSISHFPFCPPPPHPSNSNPNYYPTPNPPHPYSDPGYTNLNPTFSHLGDFRNPDRDSYPIHNPGYGGNDYNSNNNNNNNDVFDRSSKRLRVDGPYDGSYGTGPRAGGGGGVGGEFLSRRLNVVDGHGGNNVRGYAMENLDFDRNSSGTGLRPPSNGSPGMGGYNVHYQRDGVDYQTGYGSQFDMKRGVSGGGYQSHDQQVQYGQMRSYPDCQGGGVGNGNRQQLDGYNNPNYGGSYGPSESGYGSNESRHSSNGPVHYGSSYGTNESGYASNESRHSSNGPVNYGNSYGLIENGYSSNESRHFSNGPMQHGSSYGSNESGYGSNGPVLYDQRSNMPTSDHYLNNHPPVPPAMPQPGQLRYDYGSPRGLSDVRPPPPMQGYQVPAGNQNPSIRPHYGTPHMDYQGSYGSSISENMSHSSHQGLHGFDVHPPLPPSPPPPPPPPLPMEPPPGPPVCWAAEHKPLSSPPRVSSSLFPVSVDSSTPVHSSHVSISESHIRTPLLSIAQHGHTARGDLQRDPQSTMRSHGPYLGDGQIYPSKNSFIDKPKIVDAAHLFKPPNRASRPDHFVIILRGLPGSGKSYLAKMLRDLEVEYGGKAPRIHSMDDYFMTEVEVEEKEASKSTTRVKKPTVKTVLEYCYEPEMEEAYRSSMLKAFKKTLEDGAFTFVIVDDRNLRVADFAQFWATAKRSGYEVYVLEAPYKDPAGCTARNVHGFTQVDVEKMAAQWENAPSMYLQVDVKSLFHGDDLKESNIEEVDMDTEDGGIDGAEKTITSAAGDLRHYELQKDETDFETEVGNPSVVKDLGRSKWSNLDGDEDDKIEVLKGKAKILSGLDVTFGREDKSVHWGDQNGHTGFSIGAVKKANLASLVIGPGAGYNSKSNPLPEEDATTGKTGEMRKQRSVFQERLRAEQESFKAVFDRRRHRISVFDAAEDE